MDEVLYQDNHLLAWNKPAGLLTQPSGTSSDNLEDRAKEYLRQVKKKPGNVFLHAVHRLDRAVSGIVLFACTSKALSRLNADLRNRRLTKIYHAWICAGPPEDEGTLLHTLRHGDRHAEEADPGSPGARECHLDYRVLETAGPLCRVRIELHTGRYHQIRAQFAAIGCPVVGDTRYGAPSALPNGIIALHHARLEFPHPVRPERIVITAPDPAYPFVGNNDPREQISRFFGS